MEEKWLVQSACLFFLNYINIQCVFLALTGLWAVLGYLFPPPAELDCKMSGKHRKQQLQALCLSLGICVSGHVLSIVCTYITSWLCRLAVGVCQCLLLSQLQGLALSIGCAYLLPEPEACSGPY